MKYTMKIFTLVILISLLSCSNPRETKVSSENAFTDIEKICKESTDEICKNLKSNYLMIHAVDFNERELVCINLFHKPYKDLSLNDLIEWKKK